MGLGPIQAPAPALAVDQPTMFFDARSIPDGPVPMVTPDGNTVTYISTAYPLGFSDPIVDDGAFRPAVDTPPKSGFFVGGVTVPASGRVSMFFDGFDDLTPGDLSNGDHNHTNLSISKPDGSGYVLHVVATKTAGVIVASVDIIRDAAGGSATIIASVNLADDPDTLTGIFALGWQNGVYTAYQDGTAILSVADATIDPTDCEVVSVPMLQDHPAYYGRVGWIALGENKHFDPDLKPVSLTRWSETATSASAPPEHEVGALGEPAFVNSWTAAAATPDAAFGPLRFYKQNGRCYVAGSAAGGTPPSVVFTLPAGYRPAYTEIVSHHLGGIMSISDDASTPGEASGSAATNGEVSVASSVEDNVVFRFDFRIT